MSFENEKRNGHSAAPLRVLGSAKHLQDEVIHEAAAAAAATTRSGSSGDSGSDDDVGLSLAPPGVNAARAAARRDMQNQQTTLSGKQRETLKEARARTKFERQQRELAKTIDLYILLGFLIRRSNIFIHLIFFLVVA